MKMKTLPFDKLKIGRRYSMNIKLARLAILLMINVLFFMGAFAGNTNRSGTAGAQELLIPVGAAGIALGGSDVALITGTDAIFYNPAGLSRSTFGTEASFSHMSYIGDVAVNFGAVGVTFQGIGTFGASFKAFGFGNIPVTTEDNPDGTGATYSPAFVVTGLTYSRVLSDRISVGANFNFLNETIMSTSATGFSMDAGVQYNGLIVPELKLGIAIKNLGPNMRFTGADLLRPGTTVGDIRGTQTYSVDAAAFELPSQMEVALAYDRKLDEQNDITVFGDFENNNYSSDVYKLGLQYCYDNLFFARGGYNIAPQADKDQTGQSSQIYDWTLGAGLKYNVGGVNITVDYAFEHVQVLNSMNVFTLRLGF
jgi:hypothetical protein